MVCALQGAHALGQSDSKIPTDVLEAAVKRAKERTSCPETFTIGAGSSWGTTGGSIEVVQDPAGNGTMVALTNVHPATPPSTNTYTVSITVYPGQVYKEFPGTERDRRFLENMLVLSLCHEMEHMPETPGGGVGPHPNPNGQDGDQSLANKCASIRQYIRDGGRACAEAAAALNDPNLSGTDRCKLVHQFCEFHKYIQGLANRPLFLNAAQNCTPPVGASSVHIVHDCPSCGWAECPNPEHQY